MADKTIDSENPADAFSDLLVQQSQAAQEILRQQAQAGAALWGQLLPGAHAEMPDPGDAAHWAEVAQRLQAMWVDFQSEQAMKAAPGAFGIPAYFADPAQWMSLVDGWYRQMPLASPEKHQALWEQGMAVWQNVMGLDTDTPGASLPHSDRRFTDARWREQPVYTLIHQAYLMLSDYASTLVDSLEGLDPEKKRQLHFATTALVDAFSPSNFPFTNPLVLERVLETRGESLVKGMEHLIADLKRFQVF